MLGEIFQPVTANLGLVITHSIILYLHQIYMSEPGFVYGIIEDKGRSIRIWPKNPLFEKLKDLLEEGMQPLNLPTKSNAKTYEK